MSGALVTMVVTRPCDEGKALRELCAGVEWEAAVDREGTEVLMAGSAREQPQRYVSTDRMRRMFSDLAPLTPQRREAWKKDIRDAYDDELDDPYERRRKTRTSEDP